MIVVPIILLFASIFLQAHGSYGNDRTNIYEEMQEERNWILDNVFIPIQFKVFITLKYTMANNGTEITQFIEVETDAKSPLDVAAIQQKIDEKKNNIKDENDVNDSELHIKYFIQTKLPKDPTPLESAAIDNRLMEISQMLYSYLQIYTEATKPSVKNSEYTIRILTFFNIPRFYEKDLREIEIKTDPSTPLDTNEIVKQMNELKKMFNEQNGVPVEGLKFRSSIDINPADPELQLDCIDIDNKKKLIQSILHPYKFRIIIKLIYTISATGENLLQIREFEIDTVTPFEDGDFLKHTYKFINFLKEVNRSEVEIQGFIGPEFESDPTPSEFQAVARKLTKIRQLLQTQLNADLVHTS